MKLQDYFHHQKHTFLTDTEKFSLYQEIITKRDSKRSLLQRYVFAKRLVYASFVGLFVVLIYGVHFFRNDLLYMTNSLVVQRGSDTVQAGYIANIVYFDGSFVVEHNGKILQTSVIRDGDIVNLKAGTQITFHIDDQSKTQIVGPAKFVLNEQGQGESKLYTLQLLEGNFVEIQSLSDQTTQNISLIAKDIVVQQTRAQTASHFQFIKDGNTHRIENRGALLKVTHQGDKDAALETTLATRQTLALAPNDITLIDDDTQIAQILMKKDVTQTLAFSDLQKNVPVDQEITLTSLSDVFEGPESIAIDKTIIAAVDTIVTPMGQDKRVVAPEQNNQLRNNMSTTVLLQNIEGLFVSYVGGNEESFIKHIQGLQTKIIAVYKVFNIQIPDQKDPDALAYTVQLAKNLETSIDMQYYIPPRYIHNIQTIVEWLQYISDQGLGSESDASGYWKKIQPNLPNNLHFQ